MKNIIFLKNYKLTMVKICEVRVGLCGGVVGGKELVLQLVEVLHRIRVQFLCTLLCFEFRILFMLVFGMGS